MNKQKKYNIPFNLIGLKGPEELLNKIRKNLIELGAILNVINFWCADNLIVFSKSIGFLDDAKFIKIINEKKSFDYEKMIIWRTHILCFAGSNAINIEGDFVECGMHLGYSVDVLTDYINFEKSGKSYYCYDLFEGQVFDEKINMLTPHEFVIKKFEKKEYIKIIKGDIVEKLNEIKPLKISLLHIDLNSAFAEKIALEQLVPLVSLGGWIILDDYGWINYKEQKKIADEYFQKIGLFIVELPTGQGLVNVSKVSK